MSTIDSLIASIARERVERSESYRPELLAADVPATVDAITSLAARGLLRGVHDTIALQLAEIVEIRAPALTLTADEAASRVAQHLAGRSMRAYGTWVFYPWSGRLVHVLPEDEFRELRTNRNRNRITLEEQAYLRTLRMGVVGLSTGSMTTMVMAMEEVAGEFFLADFDRLSLSNMNRMRAGVHAIGEKKAHIIAREIYELNPYARVTVFAEGLTEENLEAFLLGGGRKLDLLFEECDDLGIKLRVRERARELRIPVLMETGDRGLLDVERFDLEPDRPIFHGLTAGVDPAKLRGLSNYDKAPFVLRILGSEQLSARGAASIVEIGETIKTWPQLASAVHLGAALNTDTARRIALGQLRSSGRYYVDLEELISDSKGMVSAPEPLQATIVHDALLEPERPALAPAGGLLDVDRARALVTYAGLAPSGGNCQPWRFELHGQEIHVLHLVERSASLLDFRHRASYTALGAAVENLVLAAEQMLLDAHVETSPSAAEPTKVCVVRFTQRSAPPADTRLFDQITKRVTNRKLGARVALAAGDADQLAAQAKARGSRLTLLTDPHQLEAMANILGRGDRLRFTSKVLHREMMAEIRWTPEEVLRTRDGLDIATLEATPTELAAMQLSARWPVMEMLDKLGGGSQLEKVSRKAVAAASAVGLVHADGTSPEAYFEAGRAMQRVWLEASALGYAFQPMAPITYLFARLVWGGGEGLASKEIAELRALRQPFRAVLGTSDTEAEAMLFRIARAAPPTARALRLHVDQIFAVC